MRKLIAIMAMTCLTFLSYADDLNWLDSYSDALEKASNENKFVFADFTGSDWCPWCIKLDKEVLNTSEFVAYAKENLILFKADFPKGKTISAEVKDQNVKLMNQYGVMGFPTILILDKKGDVVATMGYETGGPTPYIALIKKSIEKYKPDTRTDTQRSYDDLREMTGKPDLATDTSDAPNTIDYFQNMFKDNQS